MKTAWITGSSSGIGKAMAMEFNRHGYFTILSARRAEVLAEVQHQLPYPENSAMLVLDLAQYEGAEKWTTQALSHTGKVDILVNNSGGPHGGPLIEADEDEFRTAFERLLICNHIMAKAVVPGMKDKGVGRIVNIISTSIKQVIPGLGVSNTIRGSVAQWGKTLALELGENGICVNNILPGYTATDRLNYLAESKANSLGVDIENIRSQWAENTSLKRIGNVDEVANTVLFLASDESSYITGTSFTVDGGITAAYVTPE